MEVAPLPWALNWAHGDIAAIQIAQDAGGLAAKRRMVRRRDFRFWPCVTSIARPYGDTQGPFEVGNQVLISSHRELLSSKAMVVSVAETAGQDPVRQG